MNKLINFFGRQDVSDERCEGATHLLIMWILLDFDF